MTGWLTRHWFLVGLTVVISCGILFGMMAEAGSSALLSRVSGPAKTVLIVTILFLISFTLDGEKLRSSLAAPAPVLWAIVANIVAMPLLAWPLSRLQLHPDFAIGMLLTAAVPCTLAAASVWTRRALGNDAVSLLTTLVTNGLCFLFTPFWILLLWPDAPETGSFKEVDPVTMSFDLMIRALLPITIAQSLRLRTQFAAFADRHRLLLGNIAQSCILLIVFESSVTSGQRIQVDGTSVSLAAVVVAWLSGVVLHLGGMLVARAGARWFTFSEGDARAILFAGSQKTLPIGMQIASGTLYSYSFAVFPLLMFHTSQLFIDTAVAERLARRTAKERTATANEPPPSDTVESLPEV